MKTLQTIVILLLLGLTACNSASKNSGLTSPIDIKTETGHLSKTQELYKKSQQQIEVEQNQDSANILNMTRTLDLALKIVDKIKDKDNYSLKSDSLVIRYGHVFSGSDKHLIINRLFQYVISSDIYKLQDNRFVKVCSKDIPSLAYVGDTIQDVNGDGKPDYLFHWYPMSGCCLRDIYDVYLLKPDGNFTDEVEFINPIFLAKEKTIIGLRYGYGAPLYKYMWNEYKVDTIEYIYLPDSTNGNHFIKRKHEDYTEKGEMIKLLPDEYKKVCYGNE
jgi:hypothetical protein